MSEKQARENAKKIFAEIASEKIIHVKTKIENVQRKNHNLNSCAIRNDIRNNIYKDLNNKGFKYINRKYLKVNNYLWTKIKNYIPIEFKKYIKERIIK